MVRAALLIISGLHDKPAQKELHPILQMVRLILQQMESFTEATPLVSGSWNLIPGLLDSKSSAPCGDHWDITQVASSVPPGQAKDSPACWSPLKRAFE